MLVVAMDHVAQEDPPMEPSRFDTLTRSVTGARSRRGALAALLGGTVALISLSDTAAKLVI